MSQWPITEMSGACGCYMHAPKGRRDPAAQDAGHPQPSKHHDWMWKAASQCAGVFATLAKGQASLRI
jgi:hypothetical protein